MVKDKNSLKIFKEEQGGKRLILFVKSQWLIQYDFGAEIDKVPSGIAYRA